MGGGRSGAEAHDDLGGVGPGGCGRGRLGFACWGVGVQEAEVEVVEEVAFVEEVVALGLEGAAGGGVPGHEADVGDGADVEDGGGEVEVVAVAGEGFEEGVGGVVVGLAGLVDDGDGGGGQEEEVEGFEGGEGAVEGPGAGDFGGGGGGLV